MGVGSRRRHERGTRARLAAACAGAVAAIVAASSLGRPPAPVPLEPPAAAPRASSPAALAAAPRLPAAEGVVREAASAAPLEPLAAARPPLARVSALASDLAADPFDRAAFDAHARATAASLGRAAFEEVRTLADDGAARPEVRIAAVEVLRLLADGERIVLAPATRALLAGAFADAAADPRRAYAAVRGLAAFGDACDRARLHDALAAPGAGPARALAAVGLGASSDGDVAAELEELALRAGDPETSALAFRALQQACGSPASRRLAPQELEDRARRIADELGGARLPPDRRARAVALLGALGGAAAREALLEIVRAGDAQGGARDAAVALASLDDPQVPRELARVCADPSSDEGVRALAAEAIVRSRATRRGAELETGRRELERAARSGDRELRRRAEAALASRAVEPPAKER